MKDILVLYAKYKQYAIKLTPFSYIIPFLEAFNKVKLKSLKANSVALF